MVKVQKGVKFMKELSETDFQMDLKSVANMQKLRSFLRQ